MLRSSHQTNTTEFPRELKKWRMVGAMPNFGAVSLSEQQLEHRMAVASPRLNRSGKHLVSVAEGDAIPTGIGPTSEKSTFAVDPYRLGCSEWICRSRREVP